MSNLLAHSLDTNTRTKDVIIDENVTFESLLLPENILRGLRENGFKKPSPVQLKALPVGRCGFDLLIKSKSGTGKTLVFAIIALETVNISQNSPGALIICPTREIAVQIQDVIVLLGNYVEGLKVQSFIGGLSLNEDKEKCKLCHIAVGTPGRIKHLISEKCLDIKKVRLLVLDEADKLTEDSFYNDLNEIYNNLPNKKQIITASATYPNQLETFLSEYMVSPTQITAEIETPLLLGLKHFIAVLTPYNILAQQLKAKTEKVYKILGDISFTQCMIFFNYQSRAESICNFVNQKGFKAISISSAKTQQERLAAIKELKQFRCRILMTTDLTSRGIDAENVDLVINYDLPLDAMTYLHRMGRAGRYGSTGVCINLACGQYEVEQLQTILGYIGGSSLSIPKLPNYCGTISDLIQAKVPSEDLIYGVISKITDLKVRNKIFDLQKIRDIAKLKKPNKKSADLRKKLEVHNASNLDHSDNSIPDASSEVAADGDISNIDSSIENRTEDDISTNQINFNKSDSSISDTKKQKLDEIFCKNKALLDVTKLTLQPISVDHSDNSIPDASSEVADGDICDIDSSIENRTADDISTNQLNFNKSDSSISDTKKQKLDEIFCKNKALLDVTKLTLQPISVDNSEWTYLQDHFSDLCKQEKKQLSKHLNKDVSDILDVLDNMNELDTNDQNMSSPSPIQDDSIGIENIFTLAYKSIVKNNDGKWKNLLTEFEDKCCKTMKENKSNNNDVNNSSIHVDNNDDSMKWTPVETPRQIDVNEISSTEPTECEVMKWVPCKSSEETKIKQTCVSETVERDLVSYEHFDNYFENCSENLWQNGLSFIDVSNFDEWFQYEWEAQLYAVRNYVQQNIYVKEMAKFQSAKSKTNIQ